MGRMKDKAKDKTKKSAEKKKAGKKHRDDLKEQKVQKEQKEQKASKDQKGEKKKKGKKHHKEENAIYEDRLLTEWEPEGTAGDETSEQKESSAAAAGKAAPEKAAGGSRQRTPRRGRAKTEGGAAGGREAQAQVFRALGDESRLQILDLLEDQEMCAADLLKLLPIVQSTLSHHMKILCEAGLVICRRQGRWSYYSVNKQLFEEAADRLRERA